MHPLHLALGFSAQCATAVRLVGHSYLEKRVLAAAIISSPLPCDTCTSDTKAAVGAGCWGQDGLWPGVKPCWQLGNAQPSRSLVVGGMVVGEPHD